MDIQFPIEFIVSGTPVSLQAARSESKAEWKERVKLASSSALPEFHWVSGARMAVSLFYFPSGAMPGDLDNIIKLILDALSQYVYLDDRQVERIAIQKFEPGNIFPFASPSEKLAEAMDKEKPLLYVRVSSDPFEDLK